MADNGRKTPGPATYFIYVQTPDDSLKFVDTVEARTASHAAEKLVASNDQYVGHVLTVIPKRNVKTYNTTTETKMRVKVALAE